MTADTDEYHSASTCGAPRSRFTVVVLDPEGDLSLVRVEAEEPVAAAARALAIAAEGWDGSDDDRDDFHAEAVLRGHHGDVLAPALRGLALATTGHADTALYVLPGDAG